MVRGKRTVKAATVILLLFGALLLMGIPCALAAEITIRGEVNDEFQVVSDGQVYEVADTPEGDDLVTNHVGERVEVTGTVEETEEIKILTVKTFTTLSD